MHDGHTQRVESHHAQHHPVEALRLHHAADEEAQPLLLAAEVGGGVQLAAALHAGAAKRRAGRSCGGAERREGWMEEEKSLSPSGNDNGSFFLSEVGTAQT